jgi:hypothetical protein
MHPEAIRAQLRFHQPHLLLKRRAPSFRLSRVRVGDIQDSGNATRADLSLHTPQTLEHYIWDISFAISSGMGFTPIPS